MSHARATVNTDNCTAITIYNSFVSTCKYHSAQQVLNLLTRKVFPDFEKSNAVLVDLTKQECDALTKPLPPTATSYVQLDSSVKPAVKPCSKGQKRNSRGVCYTLQAVKSKNTCAPGQRLMCTVSPK